MKQKVECWVASNDACAGRRTRKKARKFSRFPRLKRGEINVRNNKILRTFSETRGDFSLQSFPFRFLLPHFASWSFLSVFSSSFEFKTSEGKSKRSSGSRFEMKKVRRKFLLCSTFIRRNYKNNFFYFCGGTINLTEVWCASRRPTFELVFTNQ